jgi:hypothetical protein
VGRGNRSRGGREVWVHEASQLFTFGRLAPEKESLRIFSFTADFEGPEILIPGPFGRIRLRFAPQFQLVQILHGNLAIPKPFKKMVLQGRRQIAPLNLPPLFPERHAGEFILEAFPLGRVRGRS